jgi:HK97 gp10 family phage protein
MQYQWNGDHIMEEVHRRLAAEMHGKARQVVAIAESLAPKRTGRLATSIGYTWDDADLTVVFTVGAGYGIFQEYGTRNIPPHPYLRPAINYVFSRTFGFNTEMEFLNTPHIVNPLRANAGGFDLPRGVLTKRQKEHIAKRLAPTSKRYHVGAVSRTRLHPRRRQP